MEHPARTKDSGRAGDERAALLDHLDGVQAAEAQRPGPRQTTLTFAILTGINLLNYLDRYTISGVLKQLQDKTTSGFDENLSDAQGGLLMTVFIVSFMLLSPAFGYYGDRVNRKKLIGFGVLLWSLFTFLGSFAQNYLELLFARALVGVGEASYATIGPTIIADLYPVEKRTTMLAIFYVAIPLGSALGFILGAQVAAAMGSWRWALRISPPIGVGLILLYLLCTRDPPRGASEHHRPSTAVNESSGLRAFVKDVKAVCRVPSFVWSTAGFATVTYSTGALAYWAPTYVFRQSVYAGEQISTKTASLYFGAITCVTGIAGTLLGGYLSKRYESRRQDADGLICGFGMLACVPFLAMALPMSAISMPATWVLIFCGEIFLCLNWTPVGAIVLYVIPPVQRSSAEALMILLTHLFGDALSPFLVGIISDALSDGGYDKGEALMYALFTTAIMALLGGLAFMQTAAHLATDRARASKSGAETINIDADIPDS